MKNSILWSRRSPTLDWSALPAVLFIHEKVLVAFGGAEGLRDEGALKAALARPQATYGKQLLYPTVFDQAAALLESLCQNHPFVDGNKRVAYVATAMFLQQNAWTLDVPDDEGVTFMLNVAAGKLHKEEIRIWIEGHAVPYKRSE